MKILMVLESDFPPDVRVENEVSALTDAGHEIHIACSTRNNRPAYDHFGKALIRRKRMNGFIHKSSVGVLKFPFYFAFWRGFVFSILQQQKFDAVHIHDLPLCKIGAEAKQKFGLRLIVDLHENWPALLKHATHTNSIAGKLLSSNGQWIRYEKDNVQKADLIITVIEEARDRVAELGADRHKIIIVSNTLRIESVPQLRSGTANKTFTLFYGGGINRHRGLQIVFAAMSIMKKNGKNILLKVVGDGSYLKELKKQAAVLNIENNVMFLGYKPFNEMLGILADTDAAIIPHLRTENNDASSPNKLYQYMYLGKAVISSDCLSLARIIEETGAGYIYRNDSPEELAILLGRIINEKQSLHEKGIKGREAVISRYNWKTDSTRLVSAYNRL